jgi:hypothetical protein
LPPKAFRWGQLSRRRAGPAREEAGRRSETLDGRMPGPADYGTKNKSQGSRRVHAGACLSAFLPLLFFHLPRFVRSPPQCPACGLEPSVPECTVSRALD